MTWRRMFVRWLAAGLSGLCLPVATARADNPVPYTDPAVTGHIGLCNEAGQPVRQGGIHDKPFAWLAISSDPAPAPYNGPGRTATLYAYQPRPNVPPGLWSGFQMTASSRYTNPSHPMVQATHQDASVADIIDSFPPKVDGLYQLRIQLGAPNQPTFRLSYPATDIRVTADTWTVVRGGDVACNSGTAVSAEAFLPSPTATSETGAPPGPRASGGTASPGSTASAHPGASPSPGSSSSPGVTSTGSSSPPGGGSAAGKGGNQPGSTGGSTAATLAVGVALLGLLAGGFLLLRHRRRPAGGAPPS